MLDVARQLALDIVRDGEGATRFVEIQVTGAPTAAAAREVGRAVARSALVKTAVHGGDPNWGRVLAAAGAAGVHLSPDRLRLDVASGDGPQSGAWIRLAEGGQTANPDPAAASAGRGS